jgi:anti-sigma factor RsiW
MSNFELIEQYLNNELSAEERAVFEQSLTQNEDLKSDFEFHQNLRKATMD